MSNVELGFIPEPLLIPMDNILLSRKVSPESIRSRKFDQILASIEEVGLIEPLSVVPEGKGGNQSGRYILLDGHFRLIALQQLNCTEACCLVATDDESYTYNSRVNRLSTVQEHFMLRRGACQIFCVKRGHEIIPKGKFHDRRNDYKKNKEAEGRISISG